MVLAVAALFGALGSAGAQSSFGTIVGVVADTSGTPLNGARARITGTDLLQITDASGRFTFERVRAGRYQVRAVRIGSREATDSVVVRPGETTGVTLELPPFVFVPETLPPRFSRGARPDTAPSRTETIDLVARTAKIPLLRARPPGGGRRELRVWWDGGIAVPMTLLRLTIDGDRVDGEVLRWLVQTIPDRELNPTWRAKLDSVPGWLRRDFGCGRATTDTLHHPEAQAGYRQTLVAVCTSRYRNAPDWGALLRELESQSIWTLPDASELPTLANIVGLDGHLITVEAWNGTRYHTYSFGDTDLIPHSDARKLAAIHRVLLEFLERTHADLQ